MRVSFALVNILLDVSHQRVNREASNLRGGKSVTGSQEAERLDQGVQSSLFPATHTTRSCPLSDAFLQTN